MLLVHPLLATVEQLLPLLFRLERTFSTTLFFEYLDKIANMNNISPDGLKILREKSRKFCGSFKIPLSKLKFEDVPDNPRQFDPRNAARLLENFGPEHCNRLEPDHYEPALISRADLPQGLQYNRNPFEEPRRFDPPHQLTCIDGEHRLKAADQFLAGEDRWWVANLYSDGMRSPRVLHARCLSTWWRLA